MTIIKQHEDINALLSTQHIGIDEAGRGCLAGPVVAAAVIFPAYFDSQNALHGLTDSKQLSEAKRNSLAPLIIDSALSYGIGLAWPEEVDLCNIVSANYRAMSRAVFQLIKRAKDKEENFFSTLPLLLIDGNLAISEDQWKAAQCAAPSDFYPCGLPSFSKKKKTSYPWLPSIPPLLEQLAIVKGDCRVPAIAAASVLAKTKRDTIMRKMERFYPGFGFAKHKGYGTSEHYAAITRLAPCDLHRKTFLKKMVAKEQQLTLF